MKDHLKIAGTLAKLLDNQFQIGRWKFGIDPIIGLIPGIGELIPLALSSYIVWIGIKMKIPAHQIVLMLGNILIDFLVGLVPFFGDIADFAIKSNAKNMEILRKYTKDDILEGEIL